MKDLSVVIVTHNGWKRLKNCLNSLNAFKKELFSIEVIVVDNFSGSEIYDIENSYPEFRFIHNQVNGGFANGCNLGARHASGEFLLFLNPDTVVIENEVWRLLQAARLNPYFYLVACRQVNESGKESRTIGHFPSLWNLSGIQRSLRKAFKSKKPDITVNGVLFPDWVAGSVMMIKRELFKNINCFDEDFWMYYEDVDLCRRIADTGGKIAYLRDITIEHNHGGSSRANLMVASITKTEVLISQHVYVSKHFAGPGKFLAQLYLLLNNLVAGLFTALFGIVFFFIPKLHTNTLIFFRLMSYYAGAMKRMTWVSARAIKVKNSGQTDHSWQV